MTTFTNTDTSARVWTTLTDPETGRTLELGPGESVDLDLPSDFSDPHLVRARAPKVHKESPAKTEDAPTAITTPQVAASTKE